MPDPCDRVTVRFDNVYLNGEGHIAWMMADCPYDLVIGGKDLAMTGRMTGVIRKNGGRWLFELVHLPVPYAGQDVGESYPGYGRGGFTFQDSRRSPSLFRGIDNTTRR